MGEGKNEMGEDEEGVQEKKGMYVICVEYLRLSLVLQYQSIKS